MSNTICRASRTKDRPAVWHVGRWVLPLSIDDAPSAFKPPRRPSRPPRGLLEREREREKGRPPHWYPVFDLECLLSSNVCDET